MTHPRLRLQIFTSQGNRLSLFSLQSSRDRPYLKQQDDRYQASSATGSAIALSQGSSLCLKHIRCPACVYC
jgi:hypothetical protein